MWNCLDLKCPSNDMCDYIISPEDSTQIDHLQNIVSVLSSAADHLSSDSPVFKEMEKLKDIQNHYKKMLNCDKSISFLQRIAHCLKHMVLLNLSKSYLNLAESFLCGFQKSSTYRLPSRQQVEYILVRTMTAAKLTSEVSGYAQNTFCFLLQKLKVQYLVPELMLVTNITAKFNLLVKSTLKQLCDVYSDVLPWRSKLLKSKYKWSEKLSLPKDLENWLDTFDHQIMRSFSISKTGINALSSALNIKARNVENDPDCVIVLDENERDESTINSDKKKKQKNKEKQKKKKYVKSVSSCDYTVLNTSMFLKRLRTIDELKDTPLNGSYPPNIFVPWIVFKELHKIKRKKDGTKDAERASRAIQYLDSVLVNYPGFHGQSPDEAEAWSKIYNKCYDDKILECCVVLSNKVAPKKVALLTNDKDLISRAISCKINVLNFKRKKVNKDTEFEHKDVKSTKRKRKQTEEKTDAKKSRKK